MDGAPWCGDTCVSDTAMAASTSLANAFVEAARASTHQLDADVFDKISQYNYQPFGMYEESTSYGYYYVSCDGNTSAVPSPSEIAALQANTRLSRWRASGGGRPAKASISTGSAPPPLPPPPSTPPPPTTRTGKGLGPLIGVLSVPDPPCVAAASYIMASGRGSSRATRAGVSQEELSCFTSFYADWLHTAGARVVPIPYTANASRLRELFRGVQGLVYTGGGADVTTPSSRYYLAAKTLWDLALDVTSSTPPVHACLAVSVVYQQTRRSYPAWALSEGQQSWGLLSNLGYLSRLPNGGDPGRRQPIPPVAIRGGGWCLAPAQFVGRGPLLSASGAGTGQGANPSCCERASQPKRASV
jgi:hypothetical protein